MSDVNQKDIPHVHLIVGDDSIAREQARLRIHKQIEAIHGTVMTERYDSSMMEFSSYLEKIITPSLFQEIRIFHINHAQSLSEKELKGLDQTIEYPPPDAYIIIEVDEMKKGKDDSKIIKKLNISKRCEKRPQDYTFAEFVKPPDYKISQWLTTQIPNLFKRRILKDDADYLVDLVGYDIDNLYSELQKIDIHLEPGEPVDKRAIEEIVGSTRQMTVFELATAIAERQFTRALTIIDSLFETAFYGPAMVSALFKQFWALFRIRRFAESNPDEMKRFLNSKGYNNPVQNEAAFNIGKAAGLLYDGEQRKVYPVIIASGIVGQAKKFTDNELKLIFKWLLEFDTGIKTGKIEGSLQDVQLFCYKIVRVSELVREGI
jgi:DNA polymerase III delta subunit